MKWVMQNHHVVVRKMSWFKRLLRQSERPAIVRVFYYPKAKASENRFSNVAPFLIKVSRAA